MTASTNTYNSWDEYLYASTLQGLTPQEARERALSVLAKQFPIAARPEVKFGICEGKANISEDFDAPLPAEIINSFYGD